MERLRLQLEAALEILVALLVVWVALASGNVRYLNIPVGRALRWAILAELGAVAFAYALVRRRRHRELLPLAFLPALLVALGLVSALWSPDPGLTAGRAVSLLVLFGTVGAVAYGVVGEPAAPRRVLAALLAGALVVAVGGLVDLALRPGHAVVPATTQSPARYNGLGANPNAMAMVLALALPLALAALLEARSRRRRIAIALLLALFDGSLVASGSRGALVAALVGTVVTVLALDAPQRRRRALAAALVVVFAADVAIMALPQPAKTNPASLTKTIAPPSPHDAEALLPLESEIGFPSPHSKPFRRSLLESSGRVPAWRGALRQAAERPLVGYGFGTEEEVFVDRYYLFYSSRVENSYLGTALQLGVVGLGVLLVLLASPLVEARRARRRLRGPDSAVAAACAGTVVCGLVLAVTQSYLTSVGSPATSIFWLCAFLLGAVARARAAP